jgi:hypothetical protein
MDHALKTLIALLCLGAHAIGIAQSLTDPTRPTGVPPAALVPADGSAPQAQAPRVSLVLSGNGLARAIVDGQLVSTGSETALGRVIRIYDQGVCFKRPEGQSECLRLWPETGPTTQPASPPKARVRTTP